MKKILVTGGAGFIGSHLCERLLKEGNEVICMDNYFTGSKSNIVHLLDNPYFELFRHDVTRPFFVEADEIYNLACPASPIHYQYNPVKTIKTSVMGSVHVLDLATRLKARVLQASTSEVYGDPLVHPQPEEYFGNVNPIGSRSCYDEGKRCAETLFVNYNIKNKVRIKIIRIFNTYGPNMHPDDGRVVSNFIVQALRNKDLTIYGDGSQTRSFQYISDLIDGMIQVMNTPDDIIGPLNIGNPLEISVKALADMIVELTNSKSKIKYFDLPQDDPLQRNPDISKIKKLLNWTPRVQLEEGLTNTIRYFEERLRSEQE